MLIPKQLEEYFEVIENLSKKKEKRTETFATLFKWFTNNEHGKVIATRKELRRRLDYLPAGEQRMFLKALLARGTANRAIAYRYLLDNWKQEYINDIKQLWLKYNEFTAAKLDVAHADSDFIHEHQTRLMEQVSYLRMCVVLAKYPDFKIDKDRLRPNEYLYAWQETICR